MMNVTTVRGKGRPYSPGLRGYHVLYRENEVNHCPGCSRTHWYIGRISAECGFCGTALPLAEAAGSGMGGFIRAHGALPIADAA